MANNARYIPQVRSHASSSNTDPVSSAADAALIAKMAKEIDELKKNVSTLEEQGAKLSARYNDLSRLLNNKQRSPRDALLTVRIYIRSSI